jgi:hypothetical protein
MLLLFLTSKVTGLEWISGKMPSWSLIRQWKRLMADRERLFGRKFWLGKKQQT